MTLILRLSRVSATTAPPAKSSEVTLTFKTYLYADQENQYGKGKKHSNNQKFEFLAKS